MKTKKTIIAVLVLTFILVFNTNLMRDESNNVKGSVLSPISYDIESEEQLKLEEWMVDETIFTPIFITEESERPLEVEDWMLTSF